MSKRIDDIQDDDIRIIGIPDSKNKNPKPGRKWLGYICVLAIAVCAALCVVLVMNREPKGDVKVVFDPVVNSSANCTAKPLGDYSDTSGVAYTEHLRDTINDIPLDIYIPHNAVPELVVGPMDVSDKNIILATQAADVRADNGKIVGAFVIHGEPLSWGLSKKGYCGIIDGKMTIGVADNSPLFEEATEKNGYFFRQYPLVDNGVLVENEPKGKSIRKALCDRNGEIMLVMSQTPESFHDFAQALVDLGVGNAIYTVGSNSYGYFHDKTGNFVQIHEKHHGSYEYVNFIIWRNVK